MQAAGVRPALPCLHRPRDAQQVGRPGRGTGGLLGARLGLIVELVPGEHTGCRALPGLSLRAGGQVSALREAIRFI